MSSRVEKIIGLVSKLKSDREREVAENKALELAGNQIKQEAKRLNDERCALQLRETGVVEIFEELQKHFSGSEILWGCGGARVAFVVPDVRVYTNDYTSISMWHCSYKYVTARFVDAMNINKHTQDDLSMEVGWGILSDNSYYLTHNSHISKFLPEKTFWDKPKLGFYVNNSFVRDSQKLDELLASKLSSIGSDGYEIKISRSTGLCAGNF